MREVPLRRVAAGACLALALTLPTHTAAMGVALAPRASLPTIERQVMCVTCKIPLNVAESDQASRERVLIRRLIAEGHSEAQIKSTLVDEYGPAVLALPSAKGFDLAAYLVPAAVVLALIALLAVLLPGWRRRARAQRVPESEVHRLRASDAARLQADLERFE
ncbi:MAG TPA: cytochrome c-type biogenesis protein CcmH [Solirubrobacteraceae bacterium]|jgi:cytochrome c-type biogenesis protein CcmH|nr:cytochrome c-type biogenesis protein CcmH [Solirubrobacteraceae bacterium]